MMKRVLSIVLTLILLFCIAFECSTQASAVIGIDDAILIGTVCLDLASLGISIYSVSEFCKSDTFNDFCNSIGRDIDRGVSVVKRNGKLFFATAKLQWQQICDWVKNKIKPGVQNQSVEYDVDTPTHPSFITLKDGTTVPYAGFMSNPFVVYKVPSNGRIYGFYCTGKNVGVYLGHQFYRVWCTGHGQTIGYECVNGEWTNGNPHNMNYGLTYKGVTGSFYDVNLPSGSINIVSTATQYRTMDSVDDSGAPKEEAPPNQIPEEIEPVPAVVVASSDSVYYPGSVDAPAEVIKEGELVLIEVPSNMIVEADPANPTITTDLDVIGQTLSEVTPADVKPQVLTQQGSVSGTVDQIIADTPVAELDGTNAGNAEMDIETANKFRLPQSFLEGFPFSIPYSVYCGIQAFVAEPQAPVFNIPFSIDRLGISENVSIDLTQWNPVARLCRALLSLVWVAGLAMACNKFIKR